MQKFGQIIKQIKSRNNHIENIKNSYEKRVKKRTIKIFNTLEIDIRPDGSLAVPRKGVELLDYAVVSIHSSFKQDHDQMTERQTGDRWHSSNHLWILAASHFPGGKICFR